jgi:hypothetical protein
MGEDLDKPLTYFLIAMIVMVIVFGILALSSYLGGLRH